MNWTTPVRRILHTTLPDLWVFTDEPGFLVLRSRLTNARVVDPLIDQLDGIFSGWSSIRHQSRWAGWIHHEWINNPDSFHLTCQPDRGIQFRFHF